jgi:hypothetical protein
LKRRNREAIGSTRLIRFRRLKSSKFWPRPRKSL